jgi:hypothetical protein
MNATHSQTKSTEWTNFVSFSSSVAAILSAIFAIKSQSAQVLILVCLALAGIYFVFEHHRVSGSSASISIWAIGLIAVLAIAIGSAEGSKIKDWTKDMLNGSTAGASESIDDDQPTYYMDVSVYKDDDVKPSFFEPDGAGIPGIQITVYDDNDNYVNTFTTGKDGDKEVKLGRYGNLTIGVCGISETHYLEKSHKDKQHPFRVKIGVKNGLLCD